MNIDDVEINHGVVRPMECFREGWQLIKEDYWLFLGICFIGMLIASFASLFLIGPMMCGIYMCLLQQERGKKVSFETLFQGFNYFVPSLIATLVEFVPMLILFIGWYVGGIICIAVVAGAAAGQNQQGPPPAVMLGVFGAWFGALCLLAVFNIVLNMYLLFVYLLIVEKNCSGLDAVRLSFRAGRANFGGLLGLVLLSAALSLVGLLFCGIGIIFEMPISFAMFTIAYRQIFPHHDPFARFSDYDDGDEPNEHERPRRRVGDVGDVVDTAVKVDPTA